VIIFGDPGEGSYIYPVLMIKIKVMCTSGIMYEIDDRCDECNDITLYPDEQCPECNRVSD